MSDDQVIESWVCMNCMAPCQITAKEKAEGVVDKDKCWNCGRKFTDFQAESGGDK